MIYPHWHIVLENQAREIHNFQAMSMNSTAMASIGALPYVSLCNPVPICDKSHTIIVCQAECDDDVNDEYKQQQILNDGTSNSVYPATNLVQYWYNSTLFLS